MDRGGAADPSVADELLKPVVDSGNRTSPEVAVLRDAWQRLGCPELPDGFRWQDVVDAYRRQVERQKVLSPDLRDQLIAENLCAIREAQRQIAGVQPQASEALASSWPEDEGIRDLIRERAAHDQDESVRRTAVEALVSGLGWDVRLTLSRDLNGRAPLSRPVPTHRGGTPPPGS